MRVKAGGRRVRNGRRRDDPHRLAGGLGHFQNRFQSIAPGINRNRAAVGFVAGRQRRGRGGRIGHEPIGGVSADEGNVFEAIQIQLAVARIGLFTDIAWAGARDDIAWSDRYQGVGIGTSLLDGLFRFDIARAIKGNDRWKVHLYLDGLF